MSKLIKIPLRIIGLIFLFAVTCILYVLITENISTGEYAEEPTHCIYIADNGFHTDIIIPGLDDYTSYGWGSKIFYMNVPTWDDLTFDIASEALFKDPTSVMRVTKHSYVKSNWLEVPVTEEQLDIILNEIDKTMDRDSNNEWIPIRGNFYKAIGNYSFKRTCNTWVNDIFKKANLKCSLRAFTSSAISKYYK